MRLDILTSMSGSHGIAACSSFLLILGFAAFGIVIAKQIRTTAFHPDKRVAAWRSQLMSTIERSQHDGLRSSSFCIQDSLLRNDRLKVSPIWTRMGGCELPDIWSIAFRPISKRTRPIGFDLAGEIEIRKINFVKGETISHGKTVKHGRWKALHIHVFGYGKLLDMHVWSE